MAVYVSRRRKEEEHVELFFVKMLKSRFRFYKANRALDRFQCMWAHVGVLCSVGGDQLVFGVVMM